MWWSRQLSCLSALCLLAQVRVRVYFCYRTCHAELSSARHSEVISWILLIIPGWKGAFGRVIFWNDAEHLQWKWWFIFLYSQCCWLSYPSAALLSSLQQADFSGVILSVLTCKRLIGLAPSLTWLSLMLFLLLLQPSCVCLLNQMFTSHFKFLCIPEL